MSRIVVAMYLMIVTAAGPAVCCCTLTRLTTRHAPSTSPVGDTAPSCCHHEGAKGKTGRHAPPDRPDDRGCPCKGAGQGQADALPSALDEALQSLDRLACAPADLHPAFPLDLFIADRTVASSSFRGGATAPPLSTADLLYAFHMLRC